jgi:DNA-binding response OmpR family regulator
MPYPEFCVAQQLSRLLIRTLREDGHEVFHAYDELSAVQLAMALETCDLVISNTKVEGLDGIGLILAAPTAAAPAPSVA